MSDTELVPHSDSKHDSDSTPSTPESRQPKALTVCLFAIVKNEAARIVRMLDSTLGHVTHWCVTDTGSTDGTQGLILDWYKKHGLEAVGRVASSPWPDHFGNARTLSYKNAVDWIHECGIMRHSWYLTIDADHALRTLTVPVKDAKLEQDVRCYHIEQREPSLRYSNIRLINSKYPWECIEPTHEYWTSQGDRDRAENMTCVYIHDYSDGSSHTVKFDRDERLLRADLVKHPNKERSWYYLAQTLHGLCKWDEAIEAFKKRTTLDGFYLEKFQSWMYIGDSYREKKKDEEALIAYYAAMNIEPTRAEIPLRIAKTIMNQAYQGKPHLYQSAIRWLKQARGCKQSKVRDALFLELAAYSSDLELQLGICNYRLDNMRKGFLHIDRAMLCPVTLSAQMASAQVEWFIEKQPHQLMVLPVPSGMWGWRSMNPSIVWDPKTSQYNVILRMVNYYIEQDGTYTVEGAVRTRSFWQIYDKAWGLLGSWEIVSMTPAPYPNSRIVGLEDIRLARPEGTWMATCSSLEHHKQADPEKNTVQQVLLRFENPPTVETPAHTQIAAHTCPLESPVGAEHEKNWLLLTKGTALYGFGEGCARIVDWKGTDTMTTVVRDVPSPHKINLSSFRNSAGPIPYSYSGRGGLLFVVHEVSHREGKERMYWHRWVVTDASYAITFISLPFYFIHKGIEYVAGLSASASGEEVFLGLGYRDHTAYVARVRLADIQLNSVIAYTFPDLKL